MARGSVARRITAYALTAMAWEMVPDCTLGTGGKVLPVEMACDSGMLDIMPRAAGTDEPSAPTSGGLPGGPGGMVNGVDTGRARLVVVAARSIPLVEASPRLRRSMTAGTIALKLSVMPHWMPGTTCWEMASERT